MSGAQTGSGTISGSSGSVTISAEGTTTLTYFAIDTAGNQETAKSLTVRIDKTPPGLTFGTPSPGPNTNGWNDTDVTVSCTPADALSGVASVSPGCPLLLNSEGASVSGIVVVTDVAANVATFTSPAVKIDITPPQTTAAASPTPNNAGWNNTNVSITLSATDNLSGVDHTEYNLDGAGWTVYTAPVTIAAQGMHALQYRSIDKAGNVETAQQLPIRIAKTPPEAATQFDSTKKDLLVFGKYAGSIVSAPIPPSSVVPVSWNPDDDDDADATHNGDDRAAELRTYTITDPAGNTTLLVVKVKTPSSRGVYLNARLVSIQYGAAAPTSLVRNFQEFDWKVGADGSLSTLRQTLLVGADQSQQLVSAEFDARENQTEINVANPRPQPPIRKPGLDLLEMMTSGGRLSIAY